MPAWDSAGRMELICIQRNGRKVLGCICVRVHFICRMPVCSSGVNMHASEIIFSSLRNYVCFCVCVCGLRLAQPLCWITSESICVPVRSSPGQIWQRDSSHIAVTVCCASLHLFAQALPWYRGSSSLCFGASCLLRVFGSLALTVCTVLESTAHAHRKHSWRVHISTIITHTHTQPTHTAAADLSAFHHIPEMLCWTGIWWLWWPYRDFSVMFKKPVWSDPWDVVCYSAVSRGMDTFSNNTQVGCGV